MNTQNYCMINKDTNICENVCVWDGNTNVWQPSENILMIAQSTTPSKVWILNSNIGDYELQEVLGMGSVGFTWDGTYLITNDTKPEITSYSGQDANTVIYPTR